MDRSASLDFCGVCSGGNTGIVPNSQCVQTAFGGTPHQIPGRIEAEDFDEGLPEIAYFDSDAINEGAATYRKGGVDIEATQDVDGEYNIGYVINGEWLEYTVIVAASGTYNLDLRVAADGAGKTLHIEIDGVDITGLVTVPNTGGWQVWQTVTMNDISLTAGEHIMRIAFDTDYMNLNYVEFKDIVTSIGSVERNGLTVFPIPFTDALHVEFQGRFTYQLLTVSGILLEEGSGEDFVVVGSQVQQGLYLLRVYNQEEEVLMKIIKE